MERKEQIETLMGLGKELSYIARSLNISTTGLLDGSPESTAVLNVIQALPWVIEVAEYGYDEQMADLMLQREAIKLKIENRKKELRDVCSKQK